MQDKNQAKIGFICALAAFITWGVFPIYFKQLDALSANEIVAHRILWSVLLLFLLLKFGRKLGAAKKILSNKKTTFWLFVTGLLIAANWWIYVYAVNIGKIVETSLGYFINPLVNMLLGVLILPSVSSLSLSACKFTTRAAYLSYLSFCLSRLDFIRSLESALACPL